MKGKAVIFDLDGTLLDTLQDLGESVNAVLRDHGFPVHPLDAYRLFIGEGVENLVRRALPEGEKNEALVALLVEKMRLEYDRRWSENSRPYPGVPEMLDELECRGLPKAILSNKPHHFTTVMVEKLLSSWNFAVVTGASKQMPRKPDPTAALQIARELQLSPAEIVFVGDSGTDMYTARAAGMYAAGVLWGFRDQAELREAGAQALLAEPRELLDYLL